MAGYNHDRTIQLIRLKVSSLEGKANKEYAKNCDLFVNTQGKGQPPRSLIIDFKYSGQPAGQLLSTHKIYTSNYDKVVDKSIRGFVFVAGDKVDELVADSVAEDEFAEHPGYESRIERLPGHHLISYLQFLCSDRTYERVFEPIIADIHHQYIHAVSDRAPWKERWIKLKVWILVLFAAVQHPVVQAIEKALRFKV